MRRRPYFLPSHARASFAKNLMLYKRLGVALVRTHKTRSRKYGSSGSLTSLTTLISSLPVVGYLSVGAPIEAAQRL